MWDDKYRELMKRMGVECEDMVISEMLKNIVPKDPQDEVIFEYTDVYREPDAVDILLRRWLTGDI